MSKNEKNIIDPAKYQRRVMERRARWAQEYPSLSNPAYNKDEAMQDAYGTFAIRRALFRYLVDVKHDDDDSIENVRQYRRLDPTVRIMTDEIDERVAEDQELARLMPNESDEREETGKVIKRELSNAFGDNEGSMILIDRAMIEEEHAINSNPARRFEQTMQQQIGRAVGKELKRAFEPKRQRLSKPEQDTVSEELDVEPRTEKPGGRFKDVVGSDGNLTPSQRIGLMQVAEEEIRAAIVRLSPVDNYIIAEKHRKDIDDYLAKKMGEDHEA